MRLHSWRTAWLRVVALGGVAAALAVASGIAFASPPPLTAAGTANPISANVDVNGFTSTSNNQTAQLTICFSSPIQTITAGGPGSSGASFAEHLRFVGYGGYGGNSAKTAPSGQAAGTPGATTLAPQPGGGAGFFTFSPDQTLQVSYGGILNAPNKGNSSGSSNSGAAHGGTGFQPWGANSSDPHSYTYNVRAFTGNNPSCVIVQIVATGGAPGFDLLQFSAVAVDEGAAFNINSTPALLPLKSSAGPSEVTPSPGNTSGPNVIQGSFSPNTSPNTITYGFSQDLDPNQIVPGDFCYLDSAGAQHCGTSASLNSPSTVTVLFGSNVSNPSYYEVFPGAVYSSALGVPTTGFGIGSPVAGVPTVQSVTPVQGTPGSYDLTYNECVTTQTPGSHPGLTPPSDAFFGAILADNTVIASSPPSSRVGGDCRVVRISFGSVTNFSNFASKVMRVFDSGGGVVSQSSGKPSAISGGLVGTPANMSPGNTDGPNLNGFNVVPSQNAAYYFFDNQYGALAQNASEPVAAAFGLEYKDGTNSLDQGVVGTATFVGPNEVKVAFPSSAMGTASNPVVGGLVGNGDPDEIGGPPAAAAKTCMTQKANVGEGCDGSFAVQDYQNKGNVSPQASGIGMGSTSSATTTTTATATTTTVTIKSTTKTVTKQPPATKRCSRGHHRSNGGCVKNRKHKKHHKKKHKK